MLILLQSVATWGSGRERNPQDVSCILRLLAAVTHIPCGVSSSLSSGVLAAAKLPVHPISATTMALGPYSLAPGFVPDLNVTLRLFVCCLLESIG